MPPSSGRSTPFTEELSSRKKTAPITSFIAAKRRVGVRDVIALTIGFSPFLTIASHFGESPTNPGDTELTRMGASSAARVLITPVMPALATVTIVDVGYGRSLARPPKSTI